jgi:hypothetical protein
MWRALACSADGTQLVAAGDSPIYVLHLPIPPPSVPALPRLGLHPAGGNIDISWLVPSKNFVLQENSDLTTTNWAEVPTTPTLNFTNLHYEVAVSPSPGSRFYRLKQLRK